jgi:predicted extracellular nuclease
MARSTLARIVAKVAVGALAVAAPVALAPTAAQAAPTDLFISEYIEGSSFNKAVEIYNGTGSAVDLTAGGYRLELYSNGSAAVSQSVALSGSLAAGDVFVAAHADANASILAVTDLISSAVANWNGDDAIVLRKGGINGTVLDVFGQVGTDPGTAWGTGTSSTVNNTLRRKTAIEAGDTNGADAFVPSVEWDGFGNDVVTHLGAHPGVPVDPAPSVTDTLPANEGSAAADVSPTVTFSEPVTLAAGAITLSCSISGSVALSVSGGPTTFTADPASALVDGDVCTLTVVAASVSDTDTNDPPDQMAANVTTTFTVADQCSPAAVTRIPAIQGSGPNAAITGAVTTRGVVVSDDEGPSPALRGLYIQDLTGDGDPETSDGIFVFNGNSDSASLGDVVVVSGTAEEFQNQTQISNATVSVCGTGSVDPTPVTLPMASATDFEKYEGMLVTMPQELSVTEHFQLGRFGQVVVSSDGRLQQPTNVVAPGAPALALQAANNLNRLIVDDSSQAQNPDPIVFARGGNPLSATNTLRGGDTLTGAVGVMTYTWAGNAASGNAYRLRPTNALGGYYDFAPANPRPEAPEEVGGDVRAAAMNLLNYFNTFDGLPDTRRQLHPRSGRQLPPTAAAPTRRPSSTGSGPRRSRRSSRSTPTSSASTRSRTTATAATARWKHLVDKLNAEGRRGHLRLYRRRHQHRADQRPGHRRDQGRHALQAGGRHPDRADGGAQHPRVRRGWRHRPAQPALAGPGLHGQRHRRLVRRRREPPEVQGLGLHRPRRR